MRDRLSLVFCVLLSLGLAIVSLRYVTDFWLLSFFFSLQPHIGVAAVLGALFCLVLRRNVFGWLLLSLALFLCGHAFWMQREFLPATSVAPSGSAPFRMLSFNILGDNFANVSRIVEMLNGSDADVAFVLEAAPLEHHLEKLSAAFPYRMGCGALVDGCDLMILSKHPFEQPEFMSLSDLRSDRFAMAGIRIGGKRVQLAAIHVTKPYFDDYHTEELRRAGIELRKRGGPTIIAGDFNSDTIAPDMQRFLRRNALWATGPEPATWPVEAGVFGIPIDHIYTSADIVPVSLKRIGDSYGSNHYGLIADLAVGP